jgi:uncharacterized protein
VPAYLTPRCLLLGRAHPALQFRTWPIQKTVTQTATRQCRNSRRSLHQQRLPDRWHPLVASHDRPDKLGALTERPALDGIVGSESINDVHERRLSRPRRSQLGLAVALDRLTPLRVNRSMAIEFEWDERKAAANFAKQRQLEAIEVFFDDQRLYELDYHSEEERWRTIGLVAGKVPFVVYTEPDIDVVRIISAWEATKREQREYFGQASS